MLETPQPLPHGAVRQPSGEVRWTTWAPFSEKVTLVMHPDGRRVLRPMQPAALGYHVYEEEDVEDGRRYFYKLSDGGEYPDPASRWQPDGVHRPSAVFTPEAFAWTDAAWRGVPRKQLVIYELHVGTFTREGTFAAVIPRLPELKSLGVTAIEIMPVGQFSGDRNWGYDGVHPYAVQNTYGGPRELQRLVDAAHRLGLAVFLDVIYNHLGPEGNYIHKFGPFFTDRYHTPWGDAVNFDGPQSDAVRKFVVDNACMWVTDFHLDGLRLDAVHAIFDYSARHILADLQAAVQRHAAQLGRTVHVIAETHQNDVRLTDPPERGGYGLDGVWSDDFHHSVWTVLSGERDGYYQDFGRPQHLAKVFNDVFVYDGCYSPFRRRRHGSRVEGRDRSQFVVCIHNHDQVGNRAQGDRSSTVIPFAAQRLACGLLMLAPHVPLLFMGEEYAETRPFPFFCSFGDPDLVEAVRRGRRAEFEALDFRWGSDIPDPQDPATFHAARLDWQWLPSTPHAHMRQLYTDLLAARRQWPPLADWQHTSARLLPQTASDESEPPWGLIIERGAVEKLVGVANLTDVARELPPLDPFPAQMLLSTCEQRYGGTRQPAEMPAELQPYELVILGVSSWK